MPKHFQSTIKRFLLFLAALPAFVGFVFLINYFFHDQRRENMNAAIYAAYDFARDEEETNPNRKPLRGILLPYPKEDEEHFWRAEEFVGENCKEHDCWIVEYKTILGSNKWFVNVGVTLETVHKWPQEIRGKKKYVYFVRRVQ